MKQEWMVHRQIIPQADGQRRWDLTYQSLLRWIQMTNQSGLPTQANQEEDHASSDLYPSIDATSGSNPDD
jgi:hypothetical protein